MTNILETVGTVFALFVGSTITVAVCWLVVVIALRLGEKTAGKGEDR